MGVLPVTGCCARARDWIYRTVAPWVEVAGDSEEDVMTKVICFVCICATGLAGSVGVSGGRTYFIYQSLAHIVVHVIFAVVLLVRKKADDSFLAAFALHLVTQVISTDLGSLPVQRTWPIAVVLVDMLLVIGAPSWISKTVVICTCVYLAVCELEFTLRLGIMDITGSYSFDERREQCDCAEPPCARDSAVEYVTYLFPQIFVFMLDYIFTRGFADGLRAEHKRMRSAVATADHIARCLAHFQIDEARANLARHGKVLPEAMFASFEMLLYNLESYKPYLPQACLRAQDGDCGLTKGLSEGPCPTGAGSEGEWVSTAMSGSSICSSDNLDEVVAIQPPVSNPTPGGPQLRDTFIRAKNVAIVSLSFAVRLEQRGDGREFIEQHASVISAVISVLANTRGGVLDFFDGNKVVASFNATVATAQYSLWAVRCTYSLTALVRDQCSTLMGCVVAGGARVAVLGTEQVRRPLVLGRLPRSIAQIERFAGMTGVSWVSNAKVYQDVRVHHEMRLILHLASMDAKDSLQPRRTAPTRLSNIGVMSDTASLSPRSNASTGVSSREDPPQISVPLGSAATTNYPLIYEIMPGGKNQSGAQSSSSAYNVNGDEWMYELERSAGAIWEVYNDAGALFIRTASAEGALAYMSRLDVDEAQGLLFETALRRACVIDLSARAYKHGTLPPTQQEVLQSRANSATSPRAWMSDNEGLGVSL